MMFEGRLLQDVVCGDKLSLKSVKCYVYVFEK